MKRTTWVVWVSCSQSGPLSLPPNFIIKTFSPNGKFSCGELPHLELILPVFGVF